MNPSLAPGKLDFAAMIGRMRSCVDLSHLAQRELYNKGDVVLRQGDTVPDLFILEAGLVKLFYTTAAGEEWVKAFIPDWGIFGSRNAQILSQPSQFSACCIETAQIVRLPYAALWRAAEINPTIKADLLDYSEWVGLKKERREHALLCLSAEERCKDFLRDEASLASRLSQSDIARYLGVTPIAFSRIKKRLGVCSPPRPA
jgi:CRP/FNR family transcriptional regulator, anaerobic regulatory protein